MTSYGVACDDSESGGRDDDDGGEHEGDDRGGDDDGVGDGATVPVWSDAVCATLLLLPVGTPSMTITGVALPLLLLLLLLLLLFVLAVLVAFMTDTAAAPLSTTVKCAFNLYPKCDSIFVHTF